MEKIPKPARTPLFALLLVLASMIPVFLWPEDAWWLIDEPRLIANAWHANQDAIPAAHGLTGNFRVMYGPLPTHVYQAILLITHDPATIVILRAFLCASLTAFGLLWLARSVFLPSWFAAAILVAPLVVLFQRVLWDASFTIPLGTLALAAFASFLRHGGKWPLRISLTSAFLAAIIHPQSLPIFLPIFGLVIWRYRNAIREDRRGLSWTAAVLITLNGAYLILLAGNLLWLVTKAPPTAYPGDGTRMVSALAPLLGGIFLDGWNYSHHITQLPGPAWLNPLILWSSRLISPLIWLGIIFSSLRARRTLRAWKNSEVPPPEDAIGTLALVGLLTQGAIFIAGRIPIGPQYYFGTFALHAYFAWRGMATLSRLRFGFLPAAAYGVSCAIITLGAIWTTHRHNEKKPSWPNIRQAREAVEILNQYADSPTYTDIQLLKTYPQAIRTMRLLIPRDPAQPIKKTAALFITHEKIGGVATGKIIVDELPEDKAPPMSESFDASPLPRNWVPPENTW